MKKFLSLLVIICSFALVLVSCGEKSMSDYTEKLGDGYKLTETNGDSLASNFGIDGDYDIELVVKAKSNSTGKYAYLIECGSKGDAKDLVNEVEEMLDAISTAYKVDVVAEYEGCFAFIGAESVVDEILD